MKKLLLGFIAAVWLSSCIPVDDLGDYWDKGVIDTYLIGVWKSDPHFGRAGLAPVTIVKGDNALQIDDPDEAVRKRPDYQPTFARTLKAGELLFIMVGPKQGDLIRYEVTEDKLQIFTLRARPMKGFLKQHAAQAKNIEIDECAVCRAHAINDDSHDDVKIKKLDAESFALLGQIPKTDAFWRLDNQYLRLP